MEMSMKEAKASAKRLRKFVAQCETVKPLKNYSDALNGLADVLGHKNWNTLQPKLQADADDVPELEAKEVTCVACEGNPQGSNNPCAVCGKGSQSLNEEALQLLAEANDLYTHYGLVASPDYGNCGRWINNVRRLLDKAAKSQTSTPASESSDLQIAAEDVLEWLKTGKVDGVGFCEQQMIESLEVALKVKPSGAAPEVVYTKSKSHGSKYPLINHGQFDFAKSGRLVTGHFVDLVGTIEDIPGCTASVSSVDRQKGGDLEIEYSGDTEVAWDNQHVRRDDFGNRLWLDDESYDAWSETACIIVPEDFDSKSEWSKLGIREPLVQAIAQYLAEQPDIEASLKRDYLKTVGNAEGVVGFSMTPVEDERVTQVVLPELLRQKRGG